MEEFRKKYIQGKLISGTGKGSYFVSMYSELMEKKLGFIPFPGTLNLRMEIIPQFNKTKKIILKKEGFGDVDCYPVTVWNRFLRNHFKGYLLRPHKTIHPENIIEIIALVSLRQELSLTDGDEVQCELV